MTSANPFGELFDPSTEWSIKEAIRPHWGQDGAVVFVTFRTKDSIPREVLNRWNEEKQRWLFSHGVRNNDHWSKVLPTLDVKLRGQFKQHFNRQKEAFLDTCHGACVLRRHQCAKIVADSLLHFDGQRYRMGDFIVMPNHVHLLAVFPDSDSMTKQFDSWLHYTAVQINRVIGAKGHFWQQEPFDHLVRSVDQYEYLQDYIRDNPTKAQLSGGEYLYRER